MKLFSSLHNPKSSRYVIYYSIVLVVVFTTGILRSIGIIHLSPLDFTMLHFEGFTSLFMIVRNERVGNSFLGHLSKLPVLRGMCNLK